MQNKLLLSNKIRFFFFTTIFFAMMAMKIYSVPTHGGDSVSNSVRIETIISAGMLTWVLSPLSYFGWYPFSYPSGVHSLVASLTLLTGLSIENTVLLFSYFQGFIAFLNMYVLSRNFFHKEINAVFSSLIFIFSIYILASTWNILIARSVFVIFYPLVFHSLIQMSNKVNTNRSSYFMMFLIFLITLISLHRLILFFSAIILVSYILVTVVDYFFSIKKLFLLPNFRHFLLIVLALILLFQLSEYRFYSRIIETYMTIIFEGDSSFVLLLNIYATYGTYYGACVTFLPFGAFYFLNSESRSLPKDLMTIVCLISIFFIIDASYFLVFSTPFIGILTIKSFDFFEQIRNKYLIALLSFIIYVSLLRWFVFVYSYGHFLVLIFTFLLSINIVRGVVDPKKLKTVAVSSLIIFSFLCALVAFPFKNVQIYEDSDSYSGKFNIASQDLDRSLWVDNSLSGNFLASSSDIRNSLWLYSDSQSAANHHNITNFLILSETLEVSLNFSLLYTSGQKTFDEDLDSRYNPKRIEEKIFLNNEKDLARLYAVNFIVIDKFESSTCEIKTCKYESDFVKDTRDLKYRVFSDNRVNMYHYES